VTLKADSVIGESDSMAAEVNQWPGSQLTSGRANLARAGEPIWLTCASKYFIARTSKLARQTGEARQAASNGSFFFSIRINYQ